METPSSNLCLCLFVNGIISDISYPTHHFSSANFWILVPDVDLRSVFCHYSLLQNFAFVS